ncbi:hypothetical protein C8R43DRAFT_952628 [Mycena crocata]|nr:hypothetical protein C8R43DRAFT_952628 [Mycena crocata]
MPHCCCQRFNPNVVLAPGRRRAAAPALILRYIAFPRAAQNLWAGPPRHEIKCSVVVGSPPITHSTSPWHLIRFLLRPADFIEATALRRRHINFPQATQPIPYLRRTCRAQNSIFERPENFIAALLNVEYFLVEKSIFSPAADNVQPRPQPRLKKLKLFSAVGAFPPQRVSARPHPDALLPTFRLIQHFKKFPAGRQPDSTRMDSGYIAPYYPNVTSKVPLYTLGPSYQLLTLLPPKPYAR